MKHKYFGLLVLEVRRFLSMARVVIRCCMHVLMYPLHALVFVLYSRFRNFDAWAWYDTSSVFLIFFRFGAFFIVCRFAGPTFTSAWSVYSCWQCRCHWSSELCSVSMQIFFLGFVSSVGVSDWSWFEVWRDQWKLIIYITDVDNVYIPEDPIYDQFQCVRFFIELKFSVSILFNFYNTYLINHYNWSCLSWTILWSTVPNRVFSYCKSFNAGTSQIWNSM